LSRNIDFGLEGYAPPQPGVCQRSRWSKRVSAEEKVQSGFNGCEGPQPSPGQ
jgi:hypothetical protein